jgi:hypothetical protein
MVVFGCLVEYNRVVYTVLRLFAENNWHLYSKSISDGMVNFQFYINQHDLL